MALENALPYVARGPFFIFMCDTEEFPDGPYDEFKTVLDGKVLKPDPDEYPSAKLIGYTEGDAGFARTPNQNEHKFNELDGTALKTYVDEDVKVSLTSTTPLKPTILDTISGGYHSRSVTAEKTTDYFYGGNSNQTPTKGIMLVAKQPHDNKLAFLIPSVDLGGEFGAQLTKGGIMKSGLEFTGLATAARELWWGVVDYNNSDLA